MANELVHGSVGVGMTQAEFEAVGLHVFNSQATGDLLYASSATQLSRLAIGSASNLLQVSGGIPAWTSEIDNITLDTSVAKGTWTASGTWTIPAVTLGGTVTGNNQNISALNKLGLNNTATDANRIISIQGDAITIAGGTTFYGIVLLPDLQVTSAEQTASTYGIYAGFNIAAGNTQNWTGSPSIVGVFSTLGLNDAATITSARSFDAYISGDAGTITTAYGLYIRNGTGVGFTITNQYGIFIEDMTKGGTLDIGVAIAGADTACLWISSAVDTTDAPNGIFFGASRDTNLYRSAANVLTTDDTFGAAGYKVGAAAGASFGPAAVASITVVNGIVTAIS